MKAEYFPPKEDIILQNEAPTDFYVLVTGVAVIISPFFFVKFQGNYQFSILFVQVYLLNNLLLCLNYLTGFSGSKKRS